MAETSRCISLPESISSSAWWSGRIVHHFSEPRRWTRRSRCAASQPAAGAAAVSRSGIADAVTVLADRAAMADAAATIIANAVDLPGHPRIVRVPARTLAPDSDLGDRLVTQGVGELSPAEIETALDAGVVVAHSLLADGLIRSAALHLRGDNSQSSGLDLESSTVRLLCPESRSLVHA